MSYHGYHANIAQATLNNTHFRDVVYTARYSQVVLMRLKPGECIGTEKHGADQFFRIEKGSGVVRLDNDEYPVTDGSAILVPAGATHNVTNTSKTHDLHLYTIYALPNHPEGAKYLSKAAAEKNDRPFDGQTTE